MYISDSAIHLIVDYLVTFLILRSKTEEEGHVYSTKFGQN